MNLEALNNTAERASLTLKAISNENRLMILCNLLHGERSVAELDTFIGLSQSALSQHLAVLRKTELVKTRREQQTVLYSLNGEHPRAIIETLYKLYGNKTESCAATETDKHTSQMAERMAERMSSVT